MPSANLSPRFSFLALCRTLAFGLVAGLLAGVVMLTVMACLRYFFSLATPTEMIFDRLFPFLTVDFFIGSLVKAGGYSQLKLQGVYGALTGHMVTAAVGGIVYALFVFIAPARQRAQAETVPIHPWGLRLVVPGVLIVWVIITLLLWPQLVTSYNARPPGTAMVLNALAMLVSFGACGASLMIFFALLTRPTPTGPTTDGNKNPAARNPGFIPSVTRRRFIAGGIGALSALVLGGVLRRFFQLGTFGYDGTQYGGPQVAKLTPNDKFYQVTKNLVDPDAVRDVWRLDLTGNVEEPRVYTYAELAALPAVEQETTLQCISYGVGSGLISNARWKGVPLPTLLAAAKPKSDTVSVLFHAADGFFETFPFSKAIEMTTLVAWEMNGEPLPQRHGFPVRVIVPGVYGERSAKWVTRLEFLAASDPRLTINRHGIEGVGFYTEQGWGPNIYVPTTSRFDAPQVDGDHFATPFKLGQPAELRGIAFGGDKGISKVELSFDDGKSWREAPITAPGTMISWSLWTYQWTPDQAGEFAGLVRAHNAYGEPQIVQFRDQVPHGATGLHRVRGRVDPA